ncbi:MAG: hypothetical protein U5L09_15045 [Bacteroidales bacterium]|nr:hypothetical protein [Bacteroidales bacterium]
MQSKIKAKRIRTSKHGNLKKSNFRLAERLVSNSESDDYAYVQDAASNADV